MIQLSTHIRTAPTTSTLDTRTPNVAISRNRRGDSWKEGTHRALLHASTATTHWVVTTCPTSAHTPPPRSASTTATPWASRAATKLCSANERKRIDRRRSASGTEVRTVGTTARTSDLRTSRRSGLRKPVATTGAASHNAPASTTPAAAEAQKAVLRL